MPKNPDLVFYEDTHSYFVGRTYLPSVTSILKDCQLIQDTFFTRDARERGKNIHLATAMWDTGILDEKTVDPEWKPYLEAWKKFRHEADFEPDPEMIEKPLCAKDLSYAGTPDRVGLMKGVPVLIDIKTGAPQKYHPIQLAAYRRILPFPVRQDFTVCLRKNGTYNLVGNPLEAITEGHRWDTCLAMYKLMCEITRVNSVDEALFLRF